MQKKIFIAPIILLLSMSCFSQKMALTMNEGKYINLFGDFKAYLINCIANNTDVTDSIQLKKIMSNYFFTDTPLDTMNETAIYLNQLNLTQLNSLKESVNEFYRFLREREKAHLAKYLTAMPIRFSKNAFIFSHFTKFQQENTLVFYDKRNPGKTLGYLLFIPEFKSKNSTCKIWSWTLDFKFGKFLFKSVTGEEGYEYMFNSRKK